MLLDIGPVSVGRKGIILEDILATILKAATGSYGKADLFCISRL